MSKKNNSKSIRLSDEVMNYIQSYRGEGFNEKFENIIIDAMESEDRLKQQLEYYENQIDITRDKYFLMRAQLQRMEPIVQAALHINSRIKELNMEFDKCISEITQEPEILQHK